MQQMAEISLCSVPPDTAQRRWHSREKTQMMLLQRAPRTGKGRQEYAQPARASCSKFRQMCRKESRWSLILPAQTHHTWLLEGKIYTRVHPPHPSSFISALSLTEQALHRMFFPNEPQARFWVTSYNFAPHSPVQVCSFCWLLYKGMTSPETIQVCIEKNPFYIFCVAAAEFADKKSTGAGQK